MVGCGYAGRLTVVSSLDAAEDLRDLTLELRELEVDDGAAGMQDDVYRRSDERQLVADGFAHTPLDAVAVYGTAQGFGDCESNSWARGVASSALGANRIEVGDLLGKQFTARLVDELIVGVFAQSVSLHGIAVRERRNALRMQKC